MRIGELAAAAEVSPHTLRFWERPGLLPDPGRYRDYPPAAIERVAFVRRAEAAGLTPTRSGLPLSKLHAVHHPREGSWRERCQGNDADAVVPPVGVAARRGDDRHERRSAGPFEVDR